MLGLECEGSSSSDTSSFTLNNHHDNHNCANTITNTSMLESVRKQLEETFSVEIATMKRELREEREERKQNEKRLSKCIEILMAEVVRLCAKQVKMVDKAPEHKDKANIYQRNDPDPGIDEGQGRTSTPSSQIKAEERSSGKGFQDSNDHIPLPPAETIQKQPDLLIYDQISQPQSKPNPFEIQICTIGQNLSFSGKSQKVAMNVPTPSTFTTSGVSGEVKNSQYLGSELQQSNDETNDMAGVSAADIEVLHGMTSTTGRYLPFICICGLEFESRGLLRQHIKSESEIRDQFSQTDLNVKSTQSNRSSSLEMPFSCKSCGKRFPFPSQLKLHLRRRKGMPGGGCPKRRGTFVMATGKGDKATLKPSRASRHGKDATHPRVCLCGRQYRDNLVLSQHINYYTKNRTFVCNTCGHGYRYASELQRHLERAQETGRCPSTNTRGRRRLIRKDKNGN